MKRVVSVAPGKVILTGEHSVVYGKPALLATIDRFVRVEITQGNKDEVVLNGNEIAAPASPAKHGGQAAQSLQPSPRLWLASAMTDTSTDRMKWSIDELRAFWREGQEAWRRYVELGEEKDWRQLTGDFWLVTKASLGLVYEELGVCGGVSLRLLSDIPVGSGLGSSAAVATAVIGGLGEWFGAGWSKDELYERVYMVEQLAHGRASGADPAAVVHGGCLVFQKIGEKKLFEALGLPRYTGAVRLVDTGKPVESTGEMVAMVSEKLKVESEELSTYKTIEAIGILSQRVIGQAKTGKLTFEWVKENEQLLESLGVVGEKARNILGQMKSCGVVAKVCGAGGVREGSGILLAYHDAVQLGAVLEEFKLPIYEVVLGGEGWRIE